MRVYLSILATQNLLLLQFQSNLSLLAVQPSKTICPRTILCNQTKQYNHTSPYIQQQAHLTLWAHGSSSDSITRSTLWNHIDQNEWRASLHFVLVWKGNQTSHSQFPTTDLLLPNPHYNICQLNIILHMAKILQQAVLQAQWWYKYN
jgi:hypothetical protein